MGARCSFLIWRTADIERKPSAINLGSKSLTRSAAAHSMTSSSAATSIQVLFCSGQCSQVDYCSPLGGPDIRKVEEELQCLRELIENFTTRGRSESAFSFLFAFFSALPTGPTGGNGKGACRHLSPSVTTDCP